MTEGGAGHHGAVGWGDVLDSLWNPTINFAIFAIVLFVQLRRPLLEYLRDRAQTLRAALDAGAQARRDAAALREKLERELADLPRLRESLRAELLDTAQRQRDRMLDLAQQAAARLRHDADQAATQEEAAARASLREDLVEGAVRGATDIVANAIGPDDQRRYVAEFVEEARSL